MNRTTIDPVDAHPHPARRASPPSPSEGEGVWPLALLFTLVLATTVFAADDAPTAKPITFHPTADAALTIAKAEKKVTAIYFTASWCTWCRKMQVSTFPDAAVTAVAPKFVWAKVDVDQEPATAAKYGVRALPHLVLLNVGGEVVASKPGYQTAAALSKFLAESAEKAQAPGTQNEAKIAADHLAKALTEAKDEASASAAVKAVLVKVADTRSADREGLASVLIKAGPAAWPGLVVALMDETLAVRAAASDLLRLATKQSLAFDPFAEKEERGKQADAWRTWVAENKSKSIVEPEKVEPEPAKPDEAK